MMIVAADGTGDFQTIQEAIDAVQPGNRAPAVIRVCAGKYHEKLHINKDNLRIVGDAAETTVLTNGDYAKQPAEDGTEKGTFLSYTVIITGSNVEIEHCTICNDAGP